MNKATVQEAMLLKASMESDIFRMITKFHESTGLNVGQINITHHYHGDSEKPFLSEVKIKIEI
jgi:hypothetical protein